MKRKLIFTSIAIIFACIAFIFMSSKSLQAQMPAASDYASVHKDWTVYFPEAMDQATFTDKSVSVLNEAEERVPVLLSWDKTGKILTLSPPDGGYEAGNTYRIKITEDVRSKKGESLSKAFTHSFSVYTDLPTVEDGEHLASLLEARKMKTENTVSFEFESEDSAGSIASDAGGPSTTNIQVSGIDEGDIVKTDGDTIYFLRDTDIVISRAKGEDSEYLQTIKEEHFYPTEMFLHENLLISIGYNTQPVRVMEKEITGDERISTHFSENSSVFIYDISDPASPEKIREVSSEGSIAASRLQNGYLYLIANQHPNYYIYEEIMEDDELLRPFVKDTAKNAEDGVLPYDDIYYFPDSGETNYMLLTSINLTDMEMPSQTQGYLGASNHVYMSPDNLYVAMAKHDPRPQEMMDTEMGNVSIDIMPTWRFNEDTEIFKFVVDEDEIAFQSSTVVSGTLINQFAMDERDGTLRVATTKWHESEEESTPDNNLYIYDEELRQLGSVEGLAEGEQIYSVRFMEDVAYMVTFEQIDPLFVIDLKEPANPQVLGELKIPGFSNYLHPLDEDHVIGFGEHTTVEQGNVRSAGLKISLFDVSNPANPIEKHSEIIGGEGSHTELSYNHKALYKHPEKNLFGFAASLAEIKDNGIYSYMFQGGLLYEITPDKGIEFYDSITHLENIEKDYHDWEAEIRRMVSSGNNIYSFSTGEFSVYDLDTKEVIKKVGLPEMTYQ